MTPGEQATSDCNAAKEIARLSERLREAEETIEAIRSGDVDAVVVGGPDGQQVYTLESADRPYRVLIEQMQEGAITLAADGTILYCNQRFIDLADVRRESLVGTDFARFFEGEERSLVLERIRGIEKAAAVAELTLLQRDRSGIPVNVSFVALRVETGMPSIICCVVTDLTLHRRRSMEVSAANARLAAEIEERRRAEDSLQLALEAAGMGYWDLDLRTNVVHRSNRHDQLLGYPELLPTWTLDTALQHVVPEDRQLVAAAIADARTTGIVEFEARITRAGDGATRWLHVKGRTYFEQEKPVRITGVLSDISDRKAIDDQLRQAQKMEAVGQLTGGVAHDFNNLLMIIGGSLEMLSRRLTLDEKTARLFDAARQGVLRGAKLNQQLLAFARRQDLRTEVVCVDDLIPTFEHLLDRAVGEAIIVRIEPSPEAWHCRTDPHQLETAILNLAINARDAMPQGGMLTLRTENRVVSKQAASAWGAGGGEYVLVSISDTGTGMSPDTLARAFEPFFTTKEVGKGTGLGLSQVYGFAKQSGGFVTIQSAPGSGSTVSIFLPRTDDAQNLPEADPLDRRSERPLFGTVMVVEDDADVCRTTCGMLRDIGFKVVAAGNARAALALLEDCQMVDLVFSDVIMPEGMNGIELAREIASRCPSLPVLLTSGYTAQHLTTQAMGADVPVLRKPFSQEELSRTVRATLDAAGNAEKLAR